MAQSLIPSDRRNGCIVDIGCGSSPLFLASSDFAEKIGLDKSFNSGIIESFASPNFRLIEHDIEKVVELPLETNSCDVVTMLAVIEHIEPHRLKPLLAEIYRILKPGGSIHCDDACTVDGWFAEDHGKDEACKPRGNRRAQRRL